MSKPLTCGVISRQPFLQRNLFSWLSYAQTSFHFLSKLEFIVNNSSVNQINTVSKLLSDSIAHVDM